MFQEIRRASLCAVVAVSAVLVGCAAQAPNYTPSIDNVEALKKIGGASVKTGAITAAPGMPTADTVRLRAVGMTPQGVKTYGEYIAAALRQELELAKLYNPQSGTEISGTLIRNNIDAGGISSNEGQLEIRFVVTANGQVRFDKVKKIERKWESSFAGAVAIPLAANNYPLMVQSVLGALISDPDFVKAIRN